MIIQFSNGKGFEYIDAYSREQDYYEGETRPSIEVHIPLTNTTYDEIAEVINNKSLMSSFALISDPCIDEAGNDELTINVKEGYIFGDKIITEKGVLIFKKYKASNAEIKNEELINTIDELLIAMEV